MKTYTEAEIKAMVTPDIIKKMVELAEGFEYQEDDGHTRKVINYNKYKSFYELDMRHSYIFPLLIHRAVEGWNKRKRERNFKIVTKWNRVIYVEVDFNDNMKGIRHARDRFKFYNYQPENLTHAECACLHCLIEILKEGI